MPFEIIRNDITKVNVDVIVNVTFKKYVGIIREMGKQIGSREPSPASFFCSFIQYLDIK
ncbi:hypothetical protein [Paraliobacillus sediminis]|uniref:hypothetical protein n=1 Tax=Paraliobacillus sediminis TaxID=1885916 RepID=UPI0013C3723D|nr:hypothetical protein [Paraliobacillus sediminis]